MVHLIYSKLMETSWDIIASDYIKLKVVSQNHESDSKIENKMSLKADATSSTQI